MPFVMRHTRETVRTGVRIAGVATDVVGGTTCGWATAHLQERPQEPAHRQEQGPTRDWLDA
jgi:hypothetical protein